MAEGLETIVGATVLFAEVLGGFALAYVVFRRLLLRGCGPVGAGALVLAVWGISLVLAFGIPHGEHSPGFALVPFGVVLAALPLPLLLPFRGPRRHAGARRSWVPFRLLGLGCFVLALWLAGDFLRAWHWQDLPDRLKLVTAFVAFGAWLFWLHSRLVSGGLAASVAADPRPPVLYLRAFLRDIDIFIADATPELVALSKNPLVQVGEAVSAAGLNSYVHLSFEEFFGPQIEARIGPLVALGSPEDYLPPAGAARLYARDSDWQHKLAQLADSAVMLLMEPDESANLAWELQHLRQTGLHTKLVVVTRPAIALLSPWRILHWYVRFVRWARGVQATAWPRFVVRMAGHGYTLDAALPPDGSAFGFDDDGRAVLLTTGADSPADHVEPIATWLRERRASGRHLALACACCQLACHVHRDAALQPQLCPACRVHRVWQVSGPVQRFFAGMRRRAMLAWLWLLAVVCLHFTVLVRFGRLLPEALASGWTLVVLFLVPLFGLASMPWWWPSRPKRRRDGGR